MTQLDYLPISGYIELKAALNMMQEPRFYVVSDEPSFMFTEFSEEMMENGEKVIVPGRWRRSNNESRDGDSNEYDAGSLLRDPGDSTESIILTDVEILGVKTKRRKAPSAANDDRPHSTEAEARPHAETSSPETRKISPAETSHKGAKKKSVRRKTGKDVREFGGHEPKRNEGRLDEITNTWRDVKRAFSLLCVKTFSSNATMLEAPPGSREDLVEAARTPCTPTDLDTMLYGYTNSIYVLDHKPESLPDMDMLQLFASPAGRALVTGDNRSTTRGGSTSTSLSRESSSRAKNPRRASSTVSLPTPPPRQRKSSAELYKEAVEILGLTCSLTDSCRCLDCQSNYFDCDDDCGDARTELAAGTPILLDHALSHPLTCSIQ